MVKVKSIVAGLGEVKNAEEVALSVVDLLVRQGRYDVSQNPTIKMYAILSARLLQVQAEAKRSGEYGEQYDKTIKGLSSSISNYAKLIGVFNVDGGVDEYDEDDFEDYGFDPTDL